MNSAMKKTLLASLIIPFALGAQSVSADEITEWGYNVDNSFSDFTESDGDGAVSQTDEDGTDTLTWGTDSQSSVSINDVSNPPSLFTNQESVPGGTFTHNNQVIADSDAALESFDLTSALTLEQLTPDGDANPGVPPLTFENFFSETLNSGECVADAGPACADIFTINNIGELGGMETEDGFEFSAQSFTIDDFNYTVFLELEGLTGLSGDACAEAGAADGCVGLVTAEDTENTFNTNFRITSNQVEVPEPGTLALLGMGLAGLGLSRRNAKK